MTKKYQTKLIVCIDDVPEGFVRICDSRLTNSKVEQREISNAQVRGLIPAVKFMKSPNHTAGPVFVDREAAQRHLNEYRERTNKWRSLNQKAQDPIDRLIEGGNFNEETKTPALEELIEKQNELLLEIIGELKNIKELWK